MMHRFLSSGLFSVVILDSIAALAPKAEIEGTMGDSHVGLVPRLLGQFIRKSIHDLHTSGTALIFINQIREKIGVKFGNPETQPGGRSVKFQSSVRIDVRRRKTEKDKEGEAERNLIEVKTVKNKLGMPYRSAFTSIVFGEGLDAPGEYLALAEKVGVVSKAGSWYSVFKIDPDTGEENEFAKIQGENALRERYKTDDEFRKEIHSQLDIAIP